MAQHQPPRLFVLGAGFAAPAGIPLARELLNLVLDEVAEFSPSSHLHRSLEAYLEYTEAITGMRPDPVDIESFATYLDHQHAFGLLGSDTWSTQGNRDQFLLRWGIGRVLHRSTPKPDRLPEVYVDFGRRLRAGDVLISFNYDLLLETILERVGRPYRRFPNRFSHISQSGGTIDSDGEAKEISIIKPHGSIDWVDRSSYDDQLAYMRRLQGEEGVSFSRRRDLVFGDASVSTTRPLLEGPQLQDDPMATIAVLEDLDGYFAESRVAYSHPPFVLAPSEAKQLYGAPLRGLWNGMARFGFAWGGLSIIGYSLPPADPYAKLVLYNLVRGYVTGLEDPGWRIGPMNKICLLDLRSTRAQIQELRDRFRFIPEEHRREWLGGLEATAVDWLFQATDPTQRQ